MEQSPGKIGGNAPGKNKKDGEKKKYFQYLSPFIALLVWDHVRIPVMGSLIPCPANVMVFIFLNSSGNISCMNPACAPAAVCSTIIHNP